MGKILSFETASVYDRIKYKCHNDIDDLDEEERSYLEVLLIGYFEELLYMADDEKLMQIAVEKGVVL